MSEYSVSLNDLIFICGLLASIWGAWKIIKEIKKPSDDLKKKVEDHEIKLNNDFNKINELDEYTGLVCKSLLAMIDHEITGNGIERLKNTKVELQNYLIDK